jgi:signal transduction histidine kinase/ActR/RegA family two-component response regulator
MGMSQQEHNDPDGGPAFLAGGGDTGALVRAFDWSSSPLGPPDTWPASLKTTVGILLQSRHPMFLWWGPELIQFYNDAYLPSFGKGKHPAAMGQRGEDCWQEIWPIIWPQINDVMTLGKPSWNEDHLVPIFRNGRLEEVYWTYGYSPVFDDDGGIGGTLVVCTETTSRVLAARRLQSMRGLAETAALGTSAATVITHAADVFSRATADIVFALIYNLDPQTNHAALSRAVGLADEPASVLAAFVTPQLEALARETPARQPMPRGLEVRGRLWPEPVTHFVVVPIAADPQSVAGYVVFGLSPRLPFDPAYREYLHQLCGHIAQAQARLEAFHLRAVVESERNNLLEQAPVATALLTGPKHVFRLANPLYLQIVGRADIVGKAYVEAFPELIGTALPRILDNVFETGVPFMTSEMLISLDRGGTGALEDCYFKFNLEPMRTPSGRVYGMMAVAVDITPQVQARKALERAQVDREQLVQQLERASRAKDEFLAMLGHELRNPLSPILTALQLMRLRGVQGADRERAIIERQVRHVVGLVDDLLDVSRITRGKINLKRQRLPLAEAVARAIEQTSPLIEQRRHRLHVDVPETLVVEADRGRMAQIVANILTNAAKYTEAEGQIDVVASARDGEVWLRVRDTGMGVSADMLPHVFDAFTQERQSSDRSQGGLGLGLAIVRNLVEAHGGSVALHSEGPGRGAECVVRLPLAGTKPEVGAEAPAAPPRPRKSAERGCRILIVDDNEDAAEMLAESLRGLGHEVHAALDGLSALEHARHDVPDVALLDLGLPVIDGYELAVKLRQQEGWEDVPLAALTGYGQAHDRNRTRAAGFSAHLVKPVDLGEVDATVRRLAKRKH